MKWEDAGWLSCRCCCEGKREEWMTGVVVVSSAGCRGGGGGWKRGGATAGEERRRAVLELLLAAVRRSVVACQLERACGWRGNKGKTTTTTMRWRRRWGRWRSAGPRASGTSRASPLTASTTSSASPWSSRSRWCATSGASVYAVSAESTQCTYDGKGNSVPTIFLLMQERLYAQGGLKAEGIFRINPENDQEERGTN
ncbi:hypothetical protein ACP4OV_026303 [Aristida adscensionis]